MFSTSFIVKERGERERRKGTEGKPVSLDKDQRRENWRVRGEREVGWEKHGG